MRRASFAVAVVGCVLAAACGGNDEGTTRTVLVDYRHDAFASSFIGFFPDRVEVHAGDTVSFRQVWTGEPHSVTFGASFNDELGELIKVRRRGGATDPVPVSDDLQALPVVLGRPDQSFAINQNGAQPCYLDEGLPPADPDTPCTERAQPEFNGRHAYYSSGFLPYEAEGNKYDIKLANDIEPGQYNFLCTLHGVGQSTQIVVVPDADPVPPASEVARDAQRQIEQRFAVPLRAALSDAETGELVFRGTTLRPPLAGAGSDRTLPWTGLPHRAHLHDHGTVNEFVPKRVRALVGRPVTWTFVGRHTISFNVPRYFPIFSVDRDREVRINPRAHEPVDWPGRPPGAARDRPVTVDAGAWDGRGFRSSGLDWETGDRFSMTFTEPGTYPVACLIHPQMVGEVVVE
jgi:plastocyanin